MLSVELCTLTEAKSYFDEILDKGNACMISLVSTISDADCFSGELGRVFCVSV